MFTPTVGRILLALYYMRRLSNKVRSTAGNGIVRGAWTYK